ncbi:MAG: glycine betaine ABC transporter substrate-binding protein, partial [Rhodanobacteraceae bacterium]
MTRWLLMLLACLPLALAAQTTDAPTAHSGTTTVVVGSKEFTESVVLGEIATLAAREHGTRVEYRRNLGGTRILWTALRNGDIDAYPEYTGTISHELLTDVAPDAGIGTLRARLAKLGIGITDSLGFEDNYAIGMRESEAKRLHIRTISDLAKHPDLKLAFSNEFMNRDDGWPGLRRAYHLPQ